MSDLQLLGSRKIADIDADSNDLIHAWSFTFIPLHAFRSLDDLSVRVE